MLRVLIPYGTTEGLTAKISEFVADVIRGHEATIVEVKGSITPKPDGYDAVIVGASSTWANTKIASWTSSGRTATLSNASRRPSSP
jgi:menaquinone-dependent protoporphyrinogen IX oxidase